MNLPFVKDVFRKREVPLMTEAFVVASVARYAACPRLLGNRSAYPQGG